MIHSLAGYEQRLVSQLSAPHRFALLLANLWCLVALLACGASLGFLAWRLGHSGLVSASVSLAFTLGLVLFAAYSSASLMRSQVGVGPEFIPLAGLRWSLALVMGLVALLMTQPIVLSTLGARNVDGVSSAEEMYRFERVATAQGDVAEVRGAMATVGELARRFPESGQSPVFHSQADGGVTSASPASKFHALVLANGAYRNVDPLTGPVQDGLKVKAALERLGFTVQMEIDGTNAGMERALERYRTTLQSGDTSFLFYSGHGLQYRGINYLAPVDMTADVSRIPADGISLGRAVESLAARGPHASVVVIDACRADPTGATGGGLAYLEAGTNSYIALAAKPNQVAIEERFSGGRSEGIFTAALLKHIAEPDDIDTVFRRVGQEVAARSQRLRPGVEPQQVSIQHTLRRPLVLADAAATRRGAPIGSLPDEAVDALGVCGPLIPAAQNAEGRQSLLRCLEPRWLQLSDQLRLAETRVQSLSSMQAVRGVSEGHLIRTYRSIWDRPLKPLVLTVLLAGLMAGGFLLRASLDSAHQRYAQLLHSSSRDAVADFAYGGFARASSLALPLPDKDQTLRERFLHRLEPPPAPESANAERAELISYLDSVSTPSPSATGAGT